MKAISLIWEWFRSNTRLKPRPNGYLQAPSLSEQSEQVHINGRTLGITGITIKFERQWRPFTTDWTFCYYRNVLWNGRVDQIEDNKLKTSASLKAALESMRDALTSVQIKIIFIVIAAANVLFTPFEESISVHFLRAPRLQRQSFPASYGTLRIPVSLRRSK